MRVFVLSCLSVVVLMSSLADTVEAARGRRTRRRAAAATAVAVAAAPRRTVVAAVPVVVAAPIAAQTASIELSPDLTIEDVSIEEGLHCVTVKNTGQVGSPESELRITVRRVSDNVLVATRTIKVHPLQVNQSVKFRLHALPVGHMQLVAMSDPDNRIAELNERNNDFALEIVPAAEPTPLEEVDVWVMQEKEVS